MCVCVCVVAVRRGIIYIEAYNTYRNAFFRIATRFPTAVRRYAYHMIYATLFWTYSKTEMIEHNVRTVLLAELFFF